MHAEAMEWIRAMAPKTRLDLVVELGSRDVNGSVRSLFDTRMYVGVDVMEGPGVDVIADAETFTLLRGADVVVSTEALEHTHDPWEFVMNAWWLMRPGGLFLLTTAGPRRVPHSAIDGMTPREGECYQNIYPDDLIKWWPEGHVMVAVTARGGFDTYAYAGKKGGLAWTIWK